MSTAWYRTNVIPKRVWRWRICPSLAVEVWDTTCIVTNFQADMLINPANPSLSGVSKFPYFPKGGPEPRQPPGKDAHHIMGYVTQWGGMEVGQGMLFAANVVDGLVHQIGGVPLREELERHKHCNEGDAVWTLAHGDLKDRYPGGIIHTVPPFFDQTDNSLLEVCYKSSLAEVARRQAIEDNHGDIRVACPLLGAGCRGFSVDLAINAAANALTKHGSIGTGEAKTKTATLAFAIPSGEVRKHLAQTFESILGAATIGEKE